MARCNGTPNGYPANSRSVAMPRDNGHSLPRVISAKLVLDPIGEQESIFSFYTYVIQDSQINLNMKKMYRRND